VEVRISRSQTRCRPKGWIPASQRCLGAPTLCPYGLA